MKATTRLDISLSDLLTIGERIYNIKRAFNARDGFSRKDDTLPCIILTDPVKKGRGIRAKELERMPDDYYEARG